MAVRTIGYIGLGKAGALMASRLTQAGFRLIVRDADPEREKRFAAENENAAVAPREPDGFKDAEIIVTMLPHGKIVREALLGEDGIAGGLQRGTIIIDTSSSSPYDTRSLGAELAELGLVLVDAPVTQARLHDLTSGKATFMVGSDDKATLDLIMPILQPMAAYVFHMGGLGTGHAMKTMNNYLFGVSVLAISDALVTGHKMGLDPVQMIDVLNVGTGQSFNTTYSFKTDGLPRTFATGFQLSLLIKDFGIAKSVFEREKFDTDLPDLALRHFKNAMEVVAPDADYTEVLKNWERRADVKLNVGEPSGQTASFQK